MRDWLKQNLPKQVTDFVTELLGEEQAPEPDWQFDAVLDLIQSR